jgi:hypothetical protein
MKTSEQLDKIIPALMTVKGKLQAVTKGANNPFFKSKYADLNTYLDEVEPLLAENELVLFQPVRVADITGANIVASIIMHKSGQFISSEMNVAAGNLDAQKLGAAVTYFRRYTLGALLAMKAEDDDGNTASGKTTEKKSTAIDKSPDTATKPQLTTSASVIPAQDKAPRTGFRDRLKKTAAATTTPAATSSSEDI